MAGTLQQPVQEAECMIELKHVQKSFKGQPVLKDVSLRVNTGDVVVILGPSGSGKTTLLRCINFLERADAGTLVLGDQIVDMHRAASREVLAVRRRTAFVFQNYNLFQNKTALGNIMEGLVTARHMPVADARRKAEEALAWVGLADKAAAYPSELSGGQQQRIGIARAVVLDPEVILFDEPTSALDPELVGETLAVIRKVAQRGITMIVVTHEMAFAQEAANQVIFMADGVIVEQGPPQDIFTNPHEARTRQFLSRFIAAGNMYYI